ALPGRRPVLFHPRAHPARNDTIPTRPLECRQRGLPIHRVRGDGWETSKPRAGHQGVRTTMGYQVLARKYRPQRFADVAGQDHVTVTLMNARAQNRIAHGYIFSGHRGIGKTTIARILAMALNCRNAIGSAVRPTAEPCEVCESCTEIRAGNAVDVIEIDAATNRGIDEIRELRDAA